MMTSLPTACLDIDLGALLHNYQVIQARGKGAEVAPVVKADAYGLGMATIAPFLARHGARTFFVARLEEGIALRYLLPDVTIYVLDGLSTGQESVFAAHNLRPVLNSLAQYQAWHGTTLEVALHIDTGMNRLGLLPEELLNLSTGRSPCLIMSHLACGDEPNHPFNARQLASFRSAAAHFPNVPKSFANSAGAYLGDEYQFDLIRPGISLYGGGPFGIGHPDIKPVAHLTARIMQVRPLKAGETCGYGARFTATHDMTLATIGLGYADGLLRSFAERGTALVAGKHRRLTGRISMDVFSLDVTGLDVAAGDWVELLGANQNLDTVATAAGTIGYELLTRLSDRIARHYSD